MNRRWVKAATVVWVAVVAVTLTACGGDIGPIPADAPLLVSERLTPRPAGQTDAPTGYYEYLPHGYGDDLLRPLLVSLHGYGGQGAGTVDDLERLLEIGGVPQLIRSDEWPSDRPFVVLAPQHPVPDESAYLPCVPPTPFPGSCAFALQHDLGHPPGGSPCLTPDEVHQFLTYAVGHYDVDPRRVYLTGASCGAFAIYEYLAEYGGSLVAGAVPIAGDARPAWQAAACGLGAVPIWAFHGDADDLVAVEGTTKPLAELAACPEPRQPVQVTVYPGVGHTAEVGTYNGSAGHDMFAWLLGFAKPGP